MKHLFSLLIVFLAFFIISCDHGNEASIPNQKDHKIEKRGIACPIYISPYRSAGVSQTTGAPCACERCFGGCSIKKYPTNAPSEYGGVVITIEEIFFYFTDNLDYEEESFIIDDDYEVFANVDGECVERTLLAGEYTFEHIGTYEELEGMETFGRVQVNLAE